MMNTNPKNEGVIADNEGVIADNEGVIADNEGAIADNEHMKARIPELIYKRLLILDASRAVIHKQTGRKNLESQSAIFSEFYAALMQSRMKPDIGQ